MNELPSHLGGSLDKVHTDRGALLRAIDLFAPRSFLDIGCGPGWMVDLARDRGMRAIGIDGDFTQANSWASMIPPIEVILHDFTTGPCRAFDHQMFDLGWSVEFLEHVEEQYIPNFMDLFQKCRNLIVTAAPPGWPGEHHVNCQPKEYWIEVFAEYGLVYSEPFTNAIKTASTMRKPFMQQNGMFFYNSHQTLTIETDEDSVEEV